MKPILGMDWIRRFARTFSPQQFRVQMMAQPLARRERDRNI